MEFLVSTVVPLLDQLHVDQNAVDGLTPEGASGDGSASLLSASPAKAGAPLPSPCLSARASGRTRSSSSRAPVKCDLEGRLRELTQLIETASKRLRSDLGAARDTAASNRYAAIVVYEAKTLLYYARQSPSTLREVLRLLDELLSLRLQLWSAYRSLQQRRSRDHASLAAVLRLIAKRYSAAAPQNVDTTLAVNPRLEALCLAGICEAHGSLASMRVAEASVALLECKAVLGEWAKANESLENNYTSRLQAWMVVACNALRCKMVLLCHGQAAAVRGGLNAAPPLESEPNFARQMEAFVSRTDAFSFCLIGQLGQNDALPAAALQHCGPRHLVSVALPPPPASGLASYPVLFAAGEPLTPANYLSDVVAAIIDNRPVLAKREKLAYYHFEGRSKRTLFLAAVDPNIYLALVFTGVKRKSNDRSISSGFEWITESLRLFEVYNLVLVK